MNKTLQHDPVHQALLNNAVFRPCAAPILGHPSSMSRKRYDQLWHRIWRAAGMPYRSPLKKGVLGQFTDYSTPENRVHNDFSKKDSINLTDLKKMRDICQ